MPVYLHSLGSAVPPRSYPQPFIRDLMKEWLAGDRRTERILHRVYAASEIDQRHSVVSDFAPGDPGGLFYDPESNRFLTPSTGERNGVYATEATRLAGCAARRALAASPGLRPEQVTHLVTVSCTGFFAPGPDVELVDALGLSPSVERYHVGFMGCYGAFPALRMASAFAKADPEAVVLVVAVELCTLHLQPAADLDSLLAASVFADGAAAALVSGLRPAGEALVLERFASTLVREAASEMAWTIGDTGFRMVLSSYLPELVERKVRAAVAPLLRGDEPTTARRWAVHPGGRAILDKVASALELAPEALSASRAVLARYGNMSSATVLFVLERLLAEGGEPGEAVPALAFGPGLSMESALLRRTA